MHLIVKIISIGQNSTLSGHISMQIFYFLGSLNTWCIWSIYIYIYIYIYVYRERERERETKYIMYSLNLKNIFFLWMWSEGIFYVKKLKKKVF